MATKLEEAAKSLNADRVSITGSIESVERILETLKARAAEVDEHARRMGDFIFQARERAGDEPRTKEAITQARSDAGAALGPILARDLWREMVETCESIGSTPNENDRGVYLEVIGYLFGRPTNDPAYEVNVGNVIPALPTAQVIAHFWPSMGAYLGLLPAQPAEIHQSDDTDLTKGN
jgi:hypothetical protein